MIKMSLKQADKELFYAIVSMQDGDSDEAINFVINTLQNIIKHLEDES